MADRKKLLPVVAGMGVGTVFGYFVGGMTKTRPSLTLVPTSVAVGGLYNAYATGFAPNVTLWGVNHGVPPTYFQVGKTDGNGNLTTLNAPAPSVAGNWAMIIFDPNSKDVATALLAVT